MNWREPVPALTTRSSGPECERAEPSGEPTPMLKYFLVGFEGCGSKTRSIRTPEESPPSREALARVTHRHDHTHDSPQRLACTFHQERIGLCLPTCIGLPRAALDTAPPWGGPATPRMCSRSRRRRCSGPGQRLFNCTAAPRRRQLLRPAAAAAPPRDCARRRRRRAPVGARGARGGDATQRARDGAGGAPESRRP